MRAVSKEELMAGTAERSGKVATRIQPRPPADRSLRSRAFAAPARRQGSVEPGAAPGRPPAAHDFAVVSVRPVPADPPPERGGAASVSIHQPIGIQLTRAVQRAPLLRPETASPPATAAVLSGAGPVQRYYDSNIFTMGESATFDNQSIERTDYETKYKTVVMKNRDAYQSLPDLHISNNRKLAIESTAAMAKSFYGVAGTVQTSNTALEKAGVDVRLIADGSQKITVPPRQLNQGQNVEMVKLKPGKVNRDNNDAIEDLVGFDSSECDKVVKQIIGAKERVTVIAGNKEKTGDKDAAVKIAGYMAGKHQAQQNVNADEARDYAPENLSDVQLGDLYASQDPEQMGARANTLKVNEYANPEIGEGFLIRSLMRTAQPDLTFDSKQQQKQAILELDNAQAGIDVMRQNLSAKAKAMMPTWGEHFAGVVAKDGDDVVTLENYNRNVELGFEVVRIFNNLFKKFQEFRDQVWGSVNELGTPRADMSMNEAFRYMMKAKEQVPELQEEEAQSMTQYRAAIKKATDAMATVFDLNVVGAVKLIYFRMYGAGDQSFHKQWRGVASNAVTTRIRSSFTKRKAALASTLEDLWVCFDTVLGDSDTEAPWTGIYTTFKNRYADYKLQKNTAAENAADNGALANLERTLRPDYRTWKNDLRRSIATKVKTIVGDQDLANPTTDQELIDMIQKQLDANWYSYFDFRSAAWTKAARYKKLSKLKPVAERIKKN